MELLQSERTMGSLLSSRMRKQRAIDMHVVFISIGSLSKVHKIGWLHASQNTVEALSGERGRSQKAGSARKSTLADHPRRGKEPQRFSAGDMGAYSKGMSTSAKLPGVAAFTATTTPST
jgi:hypothetical protein